MKHIALLILLANLGAILSSCGQTGPLYLPLQNNNQQTQAK
jgi:predicted small lipoprotein YifL